jgi:serine protease Do
MSEKMIWWKEKAGMGWTLLCVGLLISAGLLFNPIVVQEANARPLAQATPGSFTELVKEARPSVVNISTVKVIKGGGEREPLTPFGPQDPFKDFFDRFFKDQMPREFKQQSLGTGFIIDKDGFILTNNHVVEKTDEIKVRLSDDKEYIAQIIGRDPKTDLALIKIEPENSLTPLPMGDSDKLEVGEWVIAIGNPFGLGNTVTAGIVSAKYRQIGMGTYENFIQTDASINPGNSGGPLLNIKGEVIGINTAIFSRTGGSVGIGFAIPVNMAKELLPQLKKGKVVRGWLGVMIQTITPELKDKLDLKNEKGALVADVTSGGPADTAGIKRGDVIVMFDGKEIKEMKDLPYIVGSTPVGKEVTVEVIRKGRTERIQVKIGELEGEKEAQVEVAEGPKLGLTVHELTPELARGYGLTETSGLVVVDVEGNSPASEAGIRPGDLIVEIDQVPVRDLDRFNKIISGYRDGDTVLFLVKRRGTTLYLTLKVTE